MRICFNTTLLLVFFVRIGGAADHVSAKDGRIVLDRSGQVSTLTQTGRDSDPWISRDGRTVVFLRHAAEDMFRTSVLEMDVPTGKVAVLYAGPLSYGGRESSYFGEPELDEMRETLFLLSNQHATEASLFAIRLPSGRPRLISEHVVGYEFVPCPGRYKGDLVTLKRHEDIVGHPYYLYWLYSTSGNELGLAGAGELNIDLVSLREGDCDVWERLPLATPAPSAACREHRFGGRCRHGAPLDEAH